MKIKLSKLLPLLLLFPGLALAHSTGGETTGFAHGFGHPIGGLDHILAMVAVGLWAAQLGGRSLWTLTGTFVGVMVLGGLLGFSGVPVPFVEAGILASVVVLGILIATACKLPPLYSALLVGVFAVFHGHAHGTEMPEAVGAATYALGFAIATALLHLSGIGLGVLLHKTQLQPASRFVGGAIALSGLWAAFA